LLFVTDPLVGEVIIGAEGAVVSIVIVIMVLEGEILPAPSLASTLI
jgi:hypothetical protein